MKILQLTGRNRIQKLICVLLAICTCLSVSLAVHAAGAGTIQITQTDTQTKAPVAGIKLTLYQIASPSGSTVSGFEINEAFSSLGIDPDALGESADAEAAVQKLEQLIDAQNLAGLVTDTTDASGKVTFDGLEDGIYLVRQTNTAADFEALGYTYETESYLISLPRTGEDGVVTRTVECQPKGVLVTEDPTQLVVYKVWKDNNDKYGKRPDSITVGLYLGDALQEKVTLSAVNNWHYEWTDLDVDGTWSVKEIDIPDGYTSSVTQEGTAVTITNTYNPSKTSKTSGGTTTNKTTSKTTASRAVKTGDTTPIALWIALAATCACALMLLLYCRMRKNSK